jgi:hypothetical protein
MIKYEYVFETVDLILSEKEGSALVLTPPKEKSKTLT